MDICTYNPLIIILILKDVTDYRHKDVEHEKEYEKIALVGEKKWRQWATQFMKPFCNAEIKYFGPDQKQEAKIWIESD